MCFTLLLSAILLHGISSILEPIDEEHWYALHCVFIGEINRKLHVLSNAWNIH